MIVLSGRNIFVQMLRSVQSLKKGNAKSILLMISNIGLRRKNKKSIIAKSSTGLSQSFPDYRGLAGDEKIIASAALQLIEYDYNIALKLKISSTMFPCSSIALRAMEDRRRSAATHSKGITHEF